MKNLIVKDHPGGGARGGTGLPEAERPVACRSLRIARRQQRERRGRDEFRRSTVPQRAQKAAPIDSDTLSSRGNQRYEVGLSCWIKPNRS